MSVGRSGWSPPSAGDAFAATLPPAGLQRSRANRQRDGPNEQRLRGVEPCVRIHGWPQPSLSLENPGHPPALSMKMHKYVIKKVQKNLDTC